MRMDHDHRSPGIESQRHRSRSVQNACATRVYTAASYEYWLTAVIVSFYHRIISCALARRGMMPPMPAQRRSPARVGVYSDAEMRTVWPRSSIDDSFSSAATYRDLAEIREPFRRMHTTAFQDLKWLFSKLSLFKIHSNVIPVAQII